MKTFRHTYQGKARIFRYISVVLLGLLFLVSATLCVVLGIQNQDLRSAVERVPVPERGEEPWDEGPAPTPAALPAPAVEYPAWQALYDELYAPRAERSSVDEEKTVYLTFDDGPSAATPEILAVLDEYGVKATFFVVGKEDEQSRQWMRDIVAGGHTIGMHSYSHRYKEIYASPEAFLEDYQKIYGLISDATGVQPQISRFPGGSVNAYNGATYRDIISEVVRRGFVYFDWNASNGDASERKELPADLLTQNALSGVSTLRRAFLLMHDSADRKTTAQALPDIIRGYLDAGFTFAPLTAEVVPVVYAYPD